jgi:hypothetical protein
MILITGLSVYDNLRVVTMIEDKSSRLFVVLDSIEKVMDLKPMIIDFMSPTPQYTQDIFDHEYQVSSNVLFGFEERGLYRQFYFKSTITYPYVSAPYLSCDVNDRTVTEFTRILTYRLSYVDWSKSPFGNDTTVKQLVEYTNILKRQRVSILAVCNNQYTCIQEEIKVLCEQCSSDTTLVATDHDSRKPISEHVHHDVTRCHTLVVHVLAAAKHEYFRYFSDSSSAFGTLEKEQIWFELREHAAPLFAVRLALCKLNLFVG